jgi:ceramide glucosyltransferase
VSVQLLFQHFYFHTLILMLVRALLGMGLMAYAAYAGISVWAARQWHRVRRPVDPAWMPPVTIFKPVYGTDAHAYDNFASFCRQDYPRERVQLLFGALDPDDSALDVVRQLQRDFPQHDIGIVVPSHVQPPRGHNLKVCNLLSMLPAAKHDFFVLCDSDMRVQPDYLRKVVAPFQPEKARDTRIQNRVGLVTCPYRGYLPESLPAKLEALGIGADFMPSALASRALEGVGFAFGSTIALPRRVLEEIGGFETILNDLADDFRLGDGARRAGYDVVLSNYVVDDVLGQERFGPMWARRLRWARTVRACRPAGYAGAFITHGTLLALLFWGAMGADRIGYATLAGALALRICVAVWIAGAYTRDSNLRRYWPLLPLSDLLNSAIYIISFCGHHIMWRGQRFRLQAGGKIEHLSA